MQGTVVDLQAQSMVGQHEGISREDLVDSRVTLRDPAEDEEGLAGTSAGRNRTHARLKSKLKRQNH